MNRYSRITKPKWVSSINAIGWDLDGTLYRFYRTRKKLSELMQSEAYSAIARKKNWTQLKSSKEFNRRYDELGSHSKVLMSFGIDGIGFYTRIWDRLDLSKFIKRDEKIIQVFKNLQDKKHFIISNSNRVDQVEKKLKLIGLDPRIFRFIVPTVELQTVKPDPKPFLVALKKLVLPPRKVLYIGDKERTDIVGAKSVGMRTCLVWGKSKEADISLPSVYDVERIFDR